MNKKLKWLIILIVIVVVLYFAWQQGYLAF